MNLDVKLRTCLWFDGKGEEAAEFYVSLLPNSSIDLISRESPDGQALVLEFTLAGAPYMALNGGPLYEHSPAMSVFVLTDDQPETDRLWAAHIENGGTESMCGWLVDRYGVSWQIVPRRAVELMASGDPCAGGRVHEAMMSMRKFDIAALESAFDGG